jgi:RecA/RadA recombinase
MADIHPHGWRELAGHPGSLSHARELETLAQLADGLPGGYAVYHGIHWTRLAAGTSIVDDIDFAIVGPSGRLLLIEQTAGFLNEGAAGLTRKKGGRDLAVGSSLAASVATLSGRLRRALSTPQGGSEVPAIEALFYCPDYTVRNPGTAGLPPERIVDAARREQLPAIVREILEQEDSTAAAPQHVKLHRFLTDQLQLVPDASAIVGEAAALTTRLSGGLADWARKLHFAPFRLHVIGTAGSGKTQLALAAYADALAAGRRPLYVCYNRPLADHIAHIVERASLAGGPQGEVATYHQLCDRVARRLGRTPDFSQPGAFEKIERVLQDFAESAADERAPWMFDELIVDEGQDFWPEWAATLLRLLKPEGRAWWLEDPLQNLYGRPPVALEPAADWVEIRADVNYRSPQDIVGQINRLLALPRPIEAGSPLHSGPQGSAADAFERLVYADEAGLVEQTKRAIGQCIAAGFRREMIAVLSYRGRERSRLAARLQPDNRLGPYALRAYTGQYDLLGNPLHSDGEIVFDSLLRFKGQAAPCVVLTEMDFATLDEPARRRLFVGATRATMKLVLVLSEAAAAALAAAENAAESGAALGDPPDAGRER